MADYMTAHEAYEKMRAEHNCGDPNCGGLPEIPRTHTVEQAAHQVKRALADLAATPEGEDYEPDDIADLMVWAERLADRVQQ